MSFHGSKSEARAIISDIEESENTHSNVGSPILKGSDQPHYAGSGANKAASEVLQPGRLRAGINKPKTRTDSLTRKYAAS